MHAAYKRRFQVYVIWPILYMTYGFHTVLGKLHTDNADRAETLPNHGDDDMIATLQNLSN